MHPLEVESALECLSIAIDTREQSTELAQKRWESIGLPIYRTKLNYGDYCYCFSDPEGKELFPAVVIERKMSAEELSQSFFQNRKRFESEMQRAKDHGARIYFLIEKTTVTDILAGHYKTKVSPNAFIGTLFAWVARYGIIPIFCKAENSGRVIKEILYREAKERLSNE